MRMRMSHGRLSALLLLGLPLLLLGNKGCEADLHEADAEAVHEEGHEDAATRDDADDGEDAPPPGTPKPPAGDPTGEPKPMPALDAGTAAKDAGTVTPAKDAGSGGTAGRCGTRGGVTCAKDEFCQFAANTMCGAADQGGTCTKRPDACTLIYQPVCGCDGKTYGSACAANGAGVSVAKEGECKSSGGTPPSGGMTCGGFAGLQCGSGMFCNYEPAVGGQGCVDIADGSGVCQTQPTACTKEYKPVCGCDRRTYGNACDAHSKGVSVMHTGACTEVDCKAIGGHAVDGIGPAPVCPSGETNMGAIVYSSGAIAIEGTICCVK